MSGRRQLLHPCPDGAERLPDGRSVLIVGGGIAGLCAATILAERGAAVTLLERESHLGGRAGSWQDSLDDGTNFQMERGFHAFFRQYYNLRAILRRVDPTLAMLRALPDYPILDPHGTQQSFAGLPKRTPWNLLALSMRSPALRLRQLAGVDARAALEMLRFDASQTYGRFDHLSAKQYLDSLRFPPPARRLLFDVFAHSFFNPEAEMSAAELLMMFHYYFTGNPEGLLFDVAQQPFGRSLWEPLATRLQAHGVRIQRGCSAERVLREQQGWLVETRAGAQSQIERAQWLVLALPVRPLQQLWQRSHALRALPRTTARVQSLATTRPFAVLRLWLDRPMHESRHAFVGTTGLGILDNISLYERFQDESAAWADAQRGAVVELHAYGLPVEYPAERARNELIAGLHHFYPEARAARILHERLLLREDCPAFALGSDAQRPQVNTDDATLTLAGDFVKLPFPSALMERAASAGILAANELLGTQHVRSEPLTILDGRGWLAGRRKAVRA